MILYPQELWKRVSPWVEVSSFGRKRVRGKILEVSINSNGYYNRSPHRLVAEAFIPNPLNLPEVHHIDGNKLNNHISNLMWVTHQENMVDPIRRERLRKAMRGKNTKQIRVWNDCGYSWIFESVNEASRILNVNAGKLSQVARGQLKKSKGFYAEYI